MARGLAVLVYKLEKGKEKRKKKPTVHDVRDVNHAGDIPGVGIGEDPHVAQLPPESVGDDDNGAERRDARLGNSHVGFEPMHHLLVALGHHVPPERAREAILAGHCVYCLGLESVQRAISSSYDVAAKSGDCLH